jgi:hypothetical protein
MMLVPRPISHKRGRFGRINRCRVQPFLVFLRGRLVLMHHCETACRRSGVPFSRRMDHESLCLPGVLSRLPPILRLPQRILALVLEGG